MDLAALQSMNPVGQALLATIFTWLIIACGAATIFLMRTVSRQLMDGMLGMASGVMIAACFWSLLAPAIAMSGGGVMPAVVGFLAGGAVFFIVDRILPHLHLEANIKEAEGIKTSWHRSVLLVMAITLHHIPEGLAVGVAFGAIGTGMNATSLNSAIALMIGIGLQNFPEGMAVALPLRREGFSRRKAFFYGQASGLVEPIAGVIGAALVVVVHPLLPYAMAFAAGAMIFVVVEELIPESQRAGNSDYATAGAILGFALMMALDVMFG